jgi:hypothetical protein
LRAEGFTPRPPAASPTVSESERAPVERRDLVYSKLLRELLTLEGTHARGLLARGLSRTEVERAGYASTPTEGRGDEIARELSGRIDLEGVPGFYRDAGRWRMVSVARGFFVPYRDEGGRVQGLQVRPDDPRGAKYFWLSSREREGGTGPGSQIHFAAPHLIGDSRELVITEGGLKAHVCAFLSGQTVIGVPGVGNFGRDFAARLKSFAPHVRLAVVAYDRDLIEKREVYAALLKLCDQLQSRSFEVSVRTWPPPSKGYDDFLLSELEGAEVAA